MKISRRSALQAAGAALALPAGAAGPPAVDPTAFLGVFAKRQTVRRYKSDPVPEERIRQIVDAARRGPTCMNQQPYKFLVIRDRKKIDAMKALTLGAIEKGFQEVAARGDKKPEEVAKAKADSLRFTEGYFTAPVYVVVLVDTESPCAGYAMNHDGPIAAGYLMLAARAFGYGTAYLTDGIPDNVTTEVLKIPSRYHRICITPIGVPDGWPKMAQKRELSENLAWETLEGVPPNKPITYNP
jgi:nitroreductase